MKYSVKLVDANLNDFKGLGFSDIEYDEDGKVKKIQTMEKIAQQAKLIMFHRKSDDHWWDVNYGSDMLVSVGRKSLPVLYIFPLQVSLNESLAYLKEMHKRAGYEPSERLGSYEVHTLLQNRGSIVEITINLTSEAQDSKSVAI